MWTHFKKKEKLHSNVIFLYKFYFSMLLIEIGNLVNSSRFVSTNEYWYKWPGKLHIFYFFQQRCEWQKTHLIFLIYKNVILKAEGLKEIWALEFLWKICWLNFLPVLTGFSSLHHNLSRLEMAVLGLSLY